VYVWLFHLWKLCLAFLFDVVVTSSILFTLYCFIVQLWTKLCTYLHCIFNVINITQHFCYLTTLQFSLGRIIRVQKQLRIQYLNVHTARYFWRRIFSVVVLFLWVLFICNMSYVYLLWTVFFLSVRSFYTQICYFCGIVWGRFSK
jgi:hypothetical protein